MGGATSWPAAAAKSGVADMDAGGGLTGSQHSRSGYSLAIATPAAAANSSHAAANMTAVVVAVRLSVVYHWPGNGRPRVSIKRGSLPFAILVAVVDHIVTVVFFSFTVICSLSPTPKNIEILPTGGAVINGSPIIKRIKIINHRLHDDVL